MLLWEDYSIFGWYFKRSNSGMFMSYSRRVKNRRTSEHRRTNSLFFFFFFIITISITKETSCQPRINMEIFSRGEEEIIVVWGSEVVVVGAVGVVGPPPRLLDECRSGRVGSCGRFLQGWRRVEGHPPSPTIHHLHYTGLGQLSRRPKAGGGDVIITLITQR